MWGKLQREAKRHQDGGLRRGQSLMNALDGIDRSLYEKIYFTEADCFYDDSKVPAFLDEVCKEWYK